MSILPKPQIPGNPHEWLEHFERNAKHYLYRTRVHDLGNGHREVLIARSDRFAETPQFKSIKTLEERALANAERAARRAKSEIRRKVKAMGCDTLLTLTYRENQTDEELAKAHVKEFIRRMNRIIKGFAYVVAYEKQARGAWHMHLTIHRVLSHYMHNGYLVKSFDLVRSVWRSVVGELGGNIDIQKRKRSSKKTIAQLSAYISKYIAKSFEETDGQRLWKKRYSSSRHAMPEAMVKTTMGRDLLSLIQDAIDAYASENNCSIRACLIDGGKGFFMTVEPIKENPA